MTNEPESNEKDNAEEDQGEAEDHDGGHNQEQFAQSLEDDLESGQLSLSIIPASTVSHDVPDEIEAERNTDASEERDQDKSSEVECNEREPLEPEKEKNSTSDVTPKLR